MGAAGTLLAVLVLTALPASARSAALSVAKPCHVATVQERADGRLHETTEPLTLGGGGFAPGGLVDFTIDGVPSGSAVADANGAFARELPAPFVATGERAVTIVATDTAGTQAAVASRVARLAVSITPRAARPTSRVTFRASGFTAAVPPADVLYAHYLFAGRRVKTVRLGRVAAPCGTLTVRRRQFPGMRPRPGTWLVQFDLSSSFRRDRFPRVRVDIGVFRSAGR